MGGGGGPSPSTTPAEAQANADAAPYLAQFNSGQLTSADQATVQTGDLNATGEDLQQLANAGMLGSSAQGALLGTVSGPEGNTPMQAGAGSLVDLNKLSDTQGLLNDYENIGLQYQQEAAGQASDLGSAQAALQQQEDEDLANAGSSIGSLLDSKALQNLFQTTLPSTSYGSAGEPLGLNGSTQGDWASSSGGAFMGDEALYMSSLPGT